MLEETQALMGGDASRVGEICCYYLVEFVFLPVGGINLS